MFIEYRHSKSFLENLVREYQNMKKKNNEINNFKNIEKLPNIQISKLQA